MNDGQPSTTGSNGGRTNGGRFAQGNRLAKGNPHAKRVARLRSALLRAVKPTDMEAIIGALVIKAKHGDVPHREVIERTIGKPLEADLLDRIERLEILLSQQTSQR